MTLAELVSKLRERLLQEVESPALEAELLVAAALGVARGELRRSDRDAAAPDVERTAQALATRRLRGEPIAYLLGAREFFGRRFAVGPGVLVPRPETEHLVEVALAALAAIENGPGRFVADVCTGSGCVGVTLAAEVDSLRVIAGDLSPAAVACARANAKSLGVGARLDVVRGDLLTMVAPLPRLDLVVANPPYIEPAEFDRLDRTVRDFEPRLALVAAEGSERLRERLIRAAAMRLKPEGFLAIEVGAGQAGVAREQLRGAGFGQLAIANDLAGIGRVVSGRRRVEP